MNATSHDRSSGAAAGEEAYEVMSDGLTVNNFAPYRFGTNTV